MNLVLHFPLVDEIIDSFAPALAGDLVAYRNHVYRVLNYYLALSGQPAPSSAILVAAAFHDLGIWTHRTFDYLPPSMELASNYLAQKGMQTLEPEVLALINEHHKLLPYTGHFASIVEIFRKADLVDLSVGMIRFGLTRSLICSVRVAFPNAGFHKRLIALTLRQFVRNPLRPLPMFHW